MNKCLFDLSLNITHHSFFSEVHTDSGCKIWAKHSIGVLIEEASFTHTWISQNQKFEQIIIFDGNAHFTIVLRHKYLKHSMKNISFTNCEKDSKIS